MDTENTENTEIPKSYPELLKELNAYELARMVDVSTPDTLTSPGAMWLRHIRDWYVETRDEILGDRYPEDKINEVSGLITDAGQVPHQTHVQWQIFTDLALYHSNDIDEDSIGPITWDEISNAAGQAVGVIGERLASALYQDEPDEPTVEIDQDEAMGTFMLPPGHVDFDYNVNGESLHKALKDPEIPEALKEEARGLIEQAEPVESDLWVRSVYGYYRNMFLNPDLVTDEWKSAGDLFLGRTMQESDRDPQRHAAVLHIRKYFPEHEPRMDLIADPGQGYGNHPCTKCEQLVQYEARRDALMPVAYRENGPSECPEGGPHTVF